MHLGLCDDQGAELRNLIELVESYGEQRHRKLTFEAFQDPSLLLNRVALGQFDLLISDVVMPAMTGLSLAEAVRKLDSNLPIIFLTSSADFAVASYRVQVQDYLLKPIKQEEFFSSLDRQIQKLIQADKKISLRTKVGVVRIPVSHIVCAEAVGRRILVNQIDGAVIEVLNTLYELEEMLAEQSYFYRPHRSYLVNLRCIQRLDRDGLYTTIGKSIPVSRNNMAKLREDYMAYMLSDLMDEVHDS